MLLGDNTNSATGGARVMRYDPQTGAQLGYFGAGFLSGNIGGITADRASGRAWVQTGSAVTVFNYNTGAYMGRFSINAVVSAGLNYNSATDILSLGAGGGDGIFASNYTGSGTLLGSYGVGYSATGAMLKPGASTYFLWDVVAAGTTVRASAYNSSFAYLSSANAGYNFGGLTNNSGSYGSAFWGDYFYGMSFVGSTFTLQRVLTNGTGFVAGTVTNINTIPTVPVGNANMAAGHGDLIYVRSGNTLNMYSASTNAWIGSQVVPISNANAAGMALIIAPEPGTWAALGLGAIAMMRRRRPHS